MSSCSGETWQGPFASLAMPTGFLGVRERLSTFAKVRCNQYQHAQSHWLDQKIWTFQSCVITRLLSPAPGVAVCRLAPLAIITRHHYFYRRRSRRTHPGNPFGFHTISQNSRASETTRNIDDYSKRIVNHTERKSSRWSLCDPNHRVPGIFNQQLHSIDPRRIRVNVSVFSLRNRIDMY